MSNSMTQQNEKPSTRTAKALSLVQDVLSRNSSQSEMVEAVKKIVADFKQPAEPMDDHLPEPESMSVSDVRSLMEEYQRKTLELVQETIASKGQRKASRAIPMAHHSAKKAAHGYGLQPLKIEDRMVMTPSELRQAGIIGDELTLTLDAQQAAFDLYAVSVIMKRPVESLRRYRGYQNLLRGVQSASPMSRAMDEYTAGEGLEWVPDRWTGVMIERIDQLRVVASLFRTVPMSSLSQSYGTNGALPTVYYMGNWPTLDEDAKVPASTPGTGDLTLTAKDLVARVVIQKNLDEDSAFNVVLVQRENMAVAAAQAWEDAILNGDTAGALDIGFTYTMHPRLAYDGLRKLVNSGARHDVTAATPGTSFDHLDISHTFKLMGAPWNDQRDTAIITGNSGVIQIGDFDQVLTVDKYGPQATILTGEGGRIKNRPIIESADYHQDLNATGIYDGVTTTKTSYLVVNRRGFWIGDRKKVTLEVEDSAVRQQRNLVMVVRKAFRDVQDAATNNLVGEGYNITT